MPVYDYKCSECSHKDEMKVEYAKREETQVCPKCNKKTYVRQFSTSSKPNFDMIGGDVYSNGPNGIKGRWRLNQMHYQDVLAGKADPY